MIKEQKFYQEKWTYLQIKSSLFKSLLALQNNEGSTSHDYFYFKNYRVLDCSYFESFL